MNIYKHIKKFIIIFSSIVVLVICCVGCGEKEQATEAEEKDIVRTYSIVTDEVLSEEEIENIKSVLSARVSYYDIEGKVSVRDKDENGNPLIEISVAYGTDEAVFETLTCQGEILFVSDYGTSEEKIWLKNDDIDTVEAKMAQDLYTEYFVEIVFNKSGSEKFGECTTQLTGELLYIIYDGEVLISPSISEPVTDGVTVINNFDSMKAAQDFAMTLKSGNLAYELKNID